MPKDKTIIRKEKNNKNPYVIINKGCLADSRLSWKARGVMAYILSLPDDWRVYVNELVKHAPEGKTALYAALKELEGYGYLHRERIHENGRYAYMEYIITEEPRTEKQDAGNLNEDNLDVEFLNEDNPPLLINDLINTDVTNKQQQPVVVNAQFRQVTGQSKDLSPLIARHGPDRVLQAIAYLGRYAKRKRVDNPYGFITDALRLGWDFGSPPTANYSRLEETRQYIAEMENLPRLPQEQVSEILARMREQLK
jgi:DNA-binding MarR family transcriptional regulator